MRELHSGDGDRRDLQCWSNTKGGVWVWDDSIGGGDVSCDIITVAPGAYTENVNVTRSVEIEGAQVGNHEFTTRSANPDGESVVQSGPAISSQVFTINAADVTINGFTIRNASTGVEVTGRATTPRSSTTSFNDITSHDLSGNGRAQAVYLSSGGADNVNIENNEMKNVHSPSSAKGVQIGDNGQENASTMVQVKGNSIHDITSDTSGAYGVLVANAQQPVSGLAVVENSIHDLTGGRWVHAVGLEGDTPQVQVMSNTISNLNNASTVAVWFESNPSFGSALVEMNNFNLTAASSASPSTPH